METSGDVLMASNKIGIEELEDALNYVKALEALLENGVTSTSSMTHLNFVQLARKKLDSAISQLGGPANVKTNEELANEYLENIRIKKSKSQWEHEKGIIKRYRLFLKDKSFAEVEFTDISNFADLLAKQKLSEASIRYYLYSVRGIHKYLHRYHGFRLPDLDIWASEYRTNLPAPHKRLPIKREEVRRLIEAARSVRDKLLIAFCYYTGARVFELADLKLVDVNPKTGMVHIECGKGRKERWSRYPPEQIGNLVNLWISRERNSYPNAKDSDYFFIQRTGKQMTTGAIRKIFNNAALDAGVQEVIGKTAAEYNTGKIHLIHRLSPHIIRYCFATHTNDDNVKFEDIQRLMGHSQPQTTMRYIAQQPENIAESYKRFRGISMRRPFGEFNRKRGGEEQ
jgi:integrase/recombinase XerD